MGHAERRQFLEQDLHVHDLLHDVPLHDVSVVELPGGGTGRTVSDVRALVGPGDDVAPTAVVRALFWVRYAVGQIARWDRPRPEHERDSYLHRLPPALAEASCVRPGTPDGPFRTLYVLERESLAEIQNATVHAFLSTALCPTSGGYRLYWAVYVRPVTWLTRPYMAVIDPFRRWIVYPALLRRVRTRWRAAFG